MTIDLVIITSRFNSDRRTAGADLQRPGGLDDGLRHRHVAPVDQAIQADAGQPAL